MFPTQTLAINHMHRQRTHFNSHVTRNENNNQMNFYPITKRRRWEFEAVFKFRFILSDFYTKRISASQRSKDKNVFRLHELIHWGSFGRTNCFISWLDQDRNEWFGLHRIIFMITNKAMQWFSVCLNAVNITYPYPSTHAMNEVLREALRTSL